MALWPDISGNTINGVGEPDIRQPTPIYCHAPDATPHGPLPPWFYKRTSLRVMVARQEQQAVIDLEVPPERGETRWYVDFDRCLPFFNQHQWYAACLAACPWTLPGVAPKMVLKIAARRAARAG